MGLLKNIIEKFKSGNNKEKELEEDLKIQNKVQEKAKSANERELERYGKEAREKMIEKRLKWERAKRKHEIWKTTMMKNNVGAYIDNTLNRDRVNFFGSGKW